MFNRIRHLRISLAAKCQILFGAAVILIISAALYVPWKRMEQLIRDVNLEAGDQVARQAVQQHAADELRQPTTRPETRRSILLLERPSADVQGFVPPRLISGDSQKNLSLNRFERGALEHFADNATSIHYDEIAVVKGVARYRLAMPL